MTIFWPTFDHIYSFLQGIRIWGQKTQIFSPRREKSGNSNFMIKSKIIFFHYFYYFDWILIRFWPTFDHIYSCSQGIRIWGQKTPNFTPRREKSGNSNFIIKLNILSFKLWICFNLNHIKTQASYHHPGPPHTYQEPQFNR